MKPLVLTQLALFTVLLLPALGVATAANTQDGRQHEAQPVSDDLEAQIAELRELIARLQSALLKEHDAPATTAPERTDRRAMGMNPMGGMSGKAKGSRQVSRMSTGSGGMERNMMGGMQGMPMMDRMMMKGMSRMGGGAQGGSMSSALPGFPGASHIYHVGATGFFLDHPEHITLTVEQQQQLNAIKENALLAQSTLERQIEQAEQDLWTLTASDRPVIGEIETEVREIESLGGDQRIAFIRAVGKAAAVLTEDQRLRLVGEVAEASTRPDAHSTHED